MEVRGISERRGTRGGVGTALGAMDSWFQSIGTATETWSTGAGMESVMMEEDPSYLERPSTCSCSRSVSSALKSGAKSSTRCTIWESWRGRHEKRPSLGRLRGKRREDSPR